MNAALRAEWCKQRSTRTGLGLFAAMLGLVLLAELLHGFGLAARNADSAARQVTMLGPGQLLGTLFATLFGALSITSEIRYGTIRPTFLVTPSRGRVITAKVGVSMLIGAGFGLAAGAVAAAVVPAALWARGIAVHLAAGDVARTLVGGAAAAALWAAIGVGLGALVRNQVATLVGICAWLLFVEKLVLGDFANVSLGRFLPGAAAAAISGQTGATPVLTPAVALVLLALYAAAIVVAGSLVTMRRDVD